MKDGDPRRYDVYLSYSGYSHYKICPLRYKHRYVLKTSVRRDPRTAMFGSSIGKVFEWFYERKVWADANPVESCLRLSEEAMQEVFKEEDFSPLEDQPYVAELRSDLRQFVPAGIETIRKHRLLSENSRAEFNLTLTYRSGDIVVRLGGKADFCHWGSSVVFMDGKGSRWREKYADPFQLIWYATLYYLKYHQTPDKLGFIFWRFPEDPVQWVDYGEQDMRKLVNEAVDTCRKIRLKLFDPKPNRECVRCDYLEHCPDGKDYSSKKHVEASDRVDVEASFFEMEQM